MPLPSVWKLPRSVVTLLGWWTMGCWSLDTPQIHGRTTMLDSGSKLICQPGPHTMTHVLSRDGSIGNRDNAAPPIFKVHWKTSCTGDNDTLSLLVTREWSPFGVDRFYQLLLDNFYNCAAFFRVVPQFVIQFGLAAEPDETEKWQSSIIPDDTFPSDQPRPQTNARGFVSYATSGPNSRTSQIFININYNGHLDEMGFTPFAKVTNGLDTIIRNVYNPTPSSSMGISQDLLSKLGNEWLLQEYPNVDIILETVIELPDEDGTFASDRSVPSGTDESNHANGDSLSQGKNESALHNSAEQQQEQQQNKGNAFFSNPGKHDYDVAQKKHPLEANPDPENDEENDINTFEEKQNESSNQLEAVEMRLSVTWVIAAIAVELVLLACFSFRG